ncbi:hypothetical protein COLO4_00275 [Corchorus olitorius]|uniref:Uncharacterized protein n=1 Tax=Corchorus olitorius TaxID=93759 RepID=A0A1R3L486_9ROSI|nr:hypothetical protein COLO4_00275 [Corchorus olitorius]
MVLTLYLNCYSFKINNLSRRCVWVYMILRNVDENGGNAAESESKALKKANEVIKQLGMPRRCGYDE